MIVKFTGLEKFFPTQISSKKHKHKHKHKDHIVKYIDHFKYLPVIIEIIEMKIDYRLIR